MGMGLGIWYMVGWPQTGIWQLELASCLTVNEVLLFKPLALRLISGVAYMMKHKTVTLFE